MEMRSPLSSSSSPKSPIWAQEGDGHVIIHIPSDTVDHGVIMVPTPRPEHHHHHHSPPPPSPLPPQQPHSPPRRRLHPITTTTADTNVPPNNRRQSGGRVRRYLETPREKWLLHGLLVVVFLCFFLLWWFSSSVNLTIKDGRIIAKPTPPHRPDSLNDTELTLSRMAILKVAASPNPNFQFILSVLGQAGDPSPLTISK